MLCQARKIVIKDGMVGGESKPPKLESRLCLSFPTPAVLDVPYQ